MATSPKYPKEEYLNISWKIKNISYCWNTIRSPEFLLLQSKHCLYLDPQSLNIECGVNLLSLVGKVWQTDCQISFSTCDGSQEEFSSSTNNFHCFLKVPRHTIFEKRRSAFIPDDTLTVRCRIRTDTIRGNLLFRTRIEVKHCNYMWILKDFTKAQCSVYKSIEESSKCGNVTMNLKSAYGMDGDGQFHIEISRMGGEKCFCLFRLSVLDIHGNLVNFGRGEFIFEKEGQKIWSFPAAIKKRKLMACKDLLLPNHTLSLKGDFGFSLGRVSDQDCVISFYENIKTPCVEPNDVTKSFEKRSLSDSGADLQADLKSMLDDATLSDASLRVGSEVIQVHKNILSARAPVFKSMFTTDMKDAIDNTVVVPDLDLDTVRRLLLYIYTSTLQDKQWEGISKLYVAADKYQVLGLKKECASFLKTNLSVSNVPEVLVLTDMHQDAELKTGVLDFIAQNESEVFAADEWKEFEENNASLAFKTFRQICTIKRF